jgi:PAS domain S-box-containing protein
VRWNGAVEEILGLSADEIAMADASAFIYEEDAEEALDFGTRLMDVGSAEAELRISTREGPKNYLVTGRRVEVAGEPYLVGSAIDITERMHIERALVLVREGLKSQVEHRTAALRRANAALKSEVERRVVAQGDVERTARAHHTLSAVNRALVRESEEQDLIRAVCDAIVEVGGYRMAWVGYCVDDAECTVAPVAFSGAENATWARSSCAGTRARMPPVRCRERF